MQTTVAEQVQDGVYVPVERFSDITGLTAGIIKKLIRDGVLPAIKARSYMIHKEDGLEALRKHQENGVPAA